MGFMLNGNKTMCVDLERAYMVLSKLRGSGTRSLSLFCVSKATGRLLLTNVSLSESFLMMTSLSCYYMLMTCLLLGKMFPGLTG